MYKYKGIVIYQGQDEDGIIEVVDTAGIRALHFGSEARQSTMSLAEPNKLLSLYARTMMAWLLLKAHCDKVLMIGLGGGILPKYFLNTFPDCQIRVIEYRHSVVKVARSYFGLPLDVRLKIKIEDGAIFMRRQSVNHSAQHDLIFVDAFDHEGMAEVVTHAAFFDSCKTLLTDDGILVMNLWGSNKALFAQIAWNLRQVFSENVLFLPVRGRGNVIGFAFNDKIQKVSLKELRAKALKLESTYQLEFPDFVSDLKKHNPNTFHRVIKT